MKWLSKKHLHGAAVAVLSLLGLWVDLKVSRGNFGGRMLSYDFGNGNCEWTGATKVDLNSDPYGTLLASYPGAGMRLTWQMTQGAVGYSVGK